MDPTGCLSALSSSPPMVPETTAGWALVISIASAVVALTGVVWQLALYRLSGARLQVRLRPGALTPVGHLVRGRESGWKVPTPGAESVVGDEPWVDVAIIQVTNIGRTAVSVSEVGLDFGCHPWWKPWARHVVTGRGIPVHEGVEGDIFRLEVGASISIIVEPWGLFRAADHPAEELRVRASALPAGRRRRRSPRRRQWTIEPEQTSIWPFSAVDQDVELFQALFREVANQDPGQVYQSWIRLHALITERQDDEYPTIDELRSLLEPLLTDGASIFAAARLLGVIRGRSSEG